MAKVIISLTMSLDGFIAGPNDDFDHPLGRRDGMKLFDWYSSGTGPGEHGDARFKPKGRNQEVAKEMFATAGASLTGRRTYDIAGGWNGTHPVNGIPIVVLTHRPPKNVPQGRSTFAFTDDLKEAVMVAKAAAGDKDVGVAGASVAQQCIKAGLVDLEFVNAITTPEATHLRYRVKRKGGPR